MEQHEFLHAGLDVLEEYMNQVFSGTEKYDGEKTRELLQAFADPLVQDLHDEVGFLRSSTVICWKKWPHM